MYCSFFILISFLLGHIYFVLKNNKIKNIIFNLNKEYFVVNNIDIKRYNLIEVKDSFFLEMTMGQNAKKIIVFKLKENKIKKKDEPVKISILDYFKNGVLINKEIYTETLPLNESDNNYNFVFMFYVMKIVSFLMILILLLFYKFKYYLSLKITLICFLLFLFLMYFIKKKINKNEFSIKKY